MERAGYVFDAAVTARGIGLRALMETEMPRGVLAPFGHGPWTAITGGALLSSCGSACLPLARRDPSWRNTP
ncbi:PrsW family glutamic-type intramembrane protease [Streptomyces griseorubiginosus]|uniref:PrsW family glutamic-type intramembrane protease n=1 Tax=Streptomyces griseorubiginosus TaxID=67304 RepID=UPI00319E40D6